MKSILYLATLLSWNISIAQNLSFGWAKITNGLQGVNADHLCIDSTGTVYTTGYFQGTVNFDYGGSNTQLTTSVTSVFVSKRDPMGNLVWVKSFQGNAAGKGIAVDKNGSIYVSGNFQGTVDFDPDTTVFNVTTAGVNDAFLCKLDADGKLIWVRTFGSTLYDYGWKVSIDSRGNPVLTGTFSGTVDFDPSGATFLLSTAGYPSVFVLKLDSSGNFVWAGRIAGTREINIADVAITSNNEIVLTGGFKGTIDFNPGSNDSLISNTGLSYLPYLCCLSDSGTFIFAFSLTGGSSGIGWGRTVETDMSGNIILGGVFSNWLDFDPFNGFDSSAAVGGDDSFIAKYDARGQLLWHGIIGGPNADAIYDIKTDQFDNIYSTGAFYDKCDFDPGPDTFFMDSLSALNAWLTKWNSSGQFLWAVGAETNNISYFQSFDLDDSTNIYFAASILGQTDFDPDPNQTYHLTGSNGFDVVQAKWFQCLMHSISDSLSNCGPYDWNGTILNSTGVYIDTLVNENGCDSIVRLAFQFYPTVSYDTLAACDSLVWNGQILKQSGDFSDTSLNNIGCDSVAHLHLVLHHSNDTTIILHSCDSMTWNGHSLYHDTLIIDSLVNSEGCDSIIHHQIEIHSSASVVILQEGCDSFYFKGNYVFQSSVFVDSLQSSYGCDSMVFHFITIHNSHVDTVTLTGCDSIHFRGNAYHTSSVIIDSLQSKNGCDSITVLELVVSYSSVHPTNQQACNFYNWQGNLLTQSGIYVDSLKSSTGCDSLIVLNLSIDTIDDSVVVNSPNMFAYTAGYSYQWLDCNMSYAPIPNANSQGYTATTNGSYAVELTNNSCIDTSDCVTIVGIGLGNELSGFNNQILPNPTSGSILIRSKHYPAIVRITDQNGRLVNEFVIDTPTAVFEITDPPGLYIFTFISKEGHVESIRVIRY